jgi:hydroxyacyl-ACP dehydratase HTD2-like protein with hotdog domain
MSVRFAELAVGDALPERAHTPTNVSLFLYNAAVWISHRIHYDERYTTEVERYPGIVIDGPLQGDWLAQCVTNWLGDRGKLLRFHYSNRKAAYLGETLTSGGRIAAIDRAARTVTVDLVVKNAAGEVTSSGGATVELDDGSG